MAFYKDLQGKSRQEKQRVAENRGGFDDEGSRYGGNSGDGRRGGQRSAGGRPSRPVQGRYGDSRPAEGQGRPPRPGQGRYNDNRPAEGQGRPSRPGQGRYNDNRPAEGQGRPSRPGQGRYNDNRPAEGQGRPSRPGQGRYNDNRPMEGQGRPPRPGQGRYNDNRPPRGDGFAPRYQGDKQPSSFRDKTRPAPRGERPAPERGAPRDFRRDGNYRFAQGPQDRYSARGAGVTPPSYDEQRQARRPGEGKYDQFRYAPPAAPVAPAYRDAASDGYETDSLVNENLLSGRNPIREALKSGRDIEKLLVARGELSGSAREIVQMAKERRVPVQEVDRSRLDAITHNHQGMLAFASAYQYGTVDSMLALAEERGEKPFLILLDSVTDPHNLGAIIRTAECAGAHGVIVQERRAVGLTPAAVKASAGAVEYIPVARVTNLGNTIQSLKEKNIWVYAADMEGEDYATVDFSGPVALVIGAEGEGVGRRVLECCDHAISIPLKGKLDSLNASVAAGVLMYAVMRAR